MQRLHRGRISSHFDLRVRHVSHAWAAMAARSLRIELSGGVVEEPGGSPRLVPKESALLMVCRRWIPGEREVATLGAGGNAQVTRLDAGDIYVDDTVLYTLNYIRFLFPCSRSGADADAA